VTRKVADFSDEIVPSEGLGALSGANRSDSASSPQQATTTHVPARLVTPGISVETGLRRAAAKEQPMRNSL